MSRGYVYILTNPAMPGLIKIGKTARCPEQRCKEVGDATGVPMQFEVFEAVYSPDCDRLEREVHSELAKKRLNEAREFFGADPQVALDVIEARSQDILREWVCEFMPDHTIVHVDMLIDEADIYAMASRTLAHPCEIANAFHLIEPEELTPAIKRWRQKVEARRVAQESGQEMPPLRGIEE